MGSIDKSEVGNERRPGAENRPRPKGGVGLSEQERWRLYVMGCRGSWPVSGPEYQGFGCATSCYILKRGGHAVILDCGSGLYRGKELLRDCGQIDIFLTHLHYDHLIGLLNWGVFPVQPRFFAQFGNWFGEDTLARFISPPFWPYTQRAQVHDAASPGQVLLDGVRVLFHPSNHPDGASILRVETEDGAVCAAFDYEHTGPFPAHMAQDCAVLLYDGMYTREEYARRVGWGHSTWREGQALARENPARQVVITHHSPDRTDAALLEMEREAMADTPNLRFAREGDVLELTPVHR